MLLLFFLVLLSILTLGCRKQQRGSVKINFWAMGAEGEHVQKLIPEFERQNPGIKVRVQMIPWTAAHEKLITAYASKTMPDVFQIGNTWIPEFVALDALEKLDPYRASSGVVKEAEYFPGIWETNILDGVLYGIPWYVDTRVLFYRKDILQKAGFEDPPHSWQQLYLISRKIKENNLADYSLFIPTNEWLPFILFGIQNGSSLLKDNNSLSAFSGREFKEAFSYLIRYYKEKLAPVGMTQVSNVFQAFSQGFIAMYITGPWNVNEFKHRLPGYMQDKWMTAPVPGPIDSSYPGYSLAGGSSLAISIDSKKKPEVWKLIEFLSYKNTQIKFYREVGDLPAVKDAWQDTSLSRDIYMKAFYKQLMHVKATPKVPEWEQIVFSKVQQYAEAASTGSMSVDKALYSLDKDVNKILDKRRWMLSRK